MSSVSSPLGTFFQQAFSPPAADQNSPAQRLQPAEQQTLAPIDTVTLSGYFSSFSQLNSPAQPTQPAAAPLGAFGHASNSNPAPAAAPAAAAPEGAPGAAAQNPATTAAAGTGTGALPPAVQGASSPINASPAAQQQELAQLDQVLQQLGIDPNSIPLSEQLSMVLYLDDPSALAQLVQSLGQVVQTAHLKTLGGNPATQAQNPDQLKGPPTQEAPAAGGAANQNGAGAAAAANAPNPAARGAGGFAAQFQELQVSLVALGANDFAPAAAAAPGGALNVVA